MWFFENLLIPAGWVGQATIGWDGFLKIPACQGWKTLLPLDVG